MVATRPDISQAVGVVSRFMHNLGRSHWNAVNNRILFQIRQWNYLMEVETSRVHNHLNDRSRICSRVRRGERSSMARQLAHMFRQVDSDSAPVVYIDSQGAIALSKNLVHHNASKHIDIRYHFVPDCIISGKIGLEKISTTNNVAERNDQMSLAGPFPVPSTSDGHNDKSVRLKPDTAQDGFGQPTSAP